MNTKDFRLDINGLRAIAVVAVIFYHYGINGFSGGYVGVDVFFVISGYLMTQIINKKLAHKKFSVVNFYSARASRILPALIVMSALLLIYGYFYLTPLDYKTLGKYSTASLLFISNIVFWKQSGYFDSTAHHNFLLHTWSLSVEWQYYMLFPLFMVVLYKFKQGKFLRSGILLLFISSVALSILLTPHRPVPSFFLLPTRTWEFLAGSIAYLYASPFKRFSSQAAMAGIVLIISATVAYSNGINYPGYWAILPVLGAYLIIAADAQNFLFTNRVSQFLGDISYSLYLWHWPILIGAQYLSLDLNFPILLFLLSLTLFTSWLSFKLVEVPLRHIHLQTNRAKQLKYSLLPVFAIGAGALIYALNGMIFRVPSEHREALIANESLINEWAFPAECESLTKLSGKADTKFCTFGEDSPQKVLFWGDSHVQQWYPALMKLNQDGLTNKHQILITSIGGCPPIRGLSRIEPGYACQDFNQKVFERAMQDDIKVVVLTSVWLPYFHGNSLSGAQEPLLCSATSTCKRFNSTVEAISFSKTQLSLDLTTLIAKGKRIYLILPIPVYDRSIPEYLVKSMWFNQSKTLLLTRKQHQEATLEVSSLLKEVAINTKATVIDPADQLCPAANCFYQSEGVSLYRDNNHVSAGGALIMVPVFSKIFTN